MKSLGQGSQGPSDREARRGGEPITLGDTSGESLGGSQAPLSFWQVPGLPRKFPELPWKFFGDFPGSSLTVELNGDPGVHRKFPKLPRKFPRLPRKFPDFPGGQPLSLGSLTPCPDSQNSFSELHPDPTSSLKNMTSASVSASVSAVVAKVLKNVKL